MRVLGYKQQDIEAKLGVSTGYIGRLFRGVMQLRVDHVAELSRAMGVEAEEVLQIAFSQVRTPPSQGTQRLREVADLFHPSGAAPEPRKTSVEEETERIERIVLRTFEKFFSSMARNAGER